MDSIMVVWVETSTGWKYVVYGDRDLDNAKVYNPRRWWQLRMGLASYSERQEALSIMRTPLNISTEGNT